MTTPLAEPASLKETRAKLRRRFSPTDKAGFGYEAVFGCERNRAFCSPNVLVRVELRTSTDNSDVFRFEVFVDFHLPVGADVESAEHFNKAVQGATRKARWARGLVDGLEWSREELLP
jgi:hypothetical protein